MFKTVAELKEFIAWTRNQKIKKIKVGEVEAEFSDLAFVDQAEIDKLLNGGASTLEADSEPGSDEDDEDLYYSGN